ncbi:ABC-2 type transport system ATP-binding protein [Rhodovulum imhoffii]|uniref:ABC-2 type transport system ATP-binding protein n=1 Tax=Rhodovulum imhoffii TaxID=365340 RepID=A0A2T5BWR3_9RHOB|nr:ABC transporter ATP-binding protein [Rhodovulum imhoffii]MBK5933290.1 ABC transporter ATP-binding protein [Rhodovulum imhoffii]PTN04048.1 ABC-2 type transport system ATP-binding protein [Rhodovulum imhoffii]
MTGPNKTENADSGLSVRNVTFRYGAKVALDNLSLDVRAGAFTALLGPNGAGKSTLIALLTRLLVTREGRIVICGHDLARTPRAALTRLGVVFQQPTLDLNLSVRQNLAYFAALHGLSPAQMAPRIDAALDRLGMRERADEKARDLNGGHRRRMELARALLHDPKVLLLDEPTVGLDAAARRSITDHVHDLALQGLCVLWTTHLTDEVRDEDRLLVLHRGRIVAAGITGDIRQGAPLSDWFLKRTGGAE